MILELPAQLRGRDAGRIMSVAMQLRREWESMLKELGEDRIQTISPVLRVGGELGTFGPDGLENVEIKGGAAVCDIVVEPRNWSSMSDDEIDQLIRPRVAEVLRVLLAEAGHSAPRFLTDSYIAERASEGNP